MRQLEMLFAAIFLLSVCSFAQTQPAQNQQPASATHNSQAAVPPYQVPTPRQTQDITENLKDVHFAFDRYELSPDDRQSLQATADWLKANPSVLVTIAGDADERGSIVYNVYLSNERAKTTRDALVSMGVSENQIVFATGWGKLYPVCNQSDESCWAQNRRAHFEPWQTGSLSAADASTSATDQFSLLLPDLFR